MRRKQAGRPKLTEGRARDQVISIKLRPDEIDLLKARAKERKQSLSRYVRRLLFEGEER